MRGGKSLLAEPDTHAYGEYKAPKPTDDKRLETPARYAKRVEISVEDIAPSDPDAGYTEIEVERLKRHIAMLQEEEAERNKAAGRPGP
jgi:hypothetical protein